jgi:type I restriction enzyme, S subunit
MIGEIEVNWIVPADLASRIDAEYYQRHFIDAQSRLNRVHCVPFHTLWKDSYRIYMGIKGYDEVADSHEFTPYLRPVDIDDIGFVNLEQLGWCEASWLKDYGEQGTAKPNDLIVEVKGNTRKVAVLPSTVPENCIVSGSAWRIQISEKADRNFIQAYLFSDTGQLLKRRQISNSIISWIDPRAFKTLSIPLPDPKIQAYIGAKVRLAEKCRDEAGKLFSEAQTMFAEAVRVSEFNPRSNNSNIIQSKQMTNRLSAEFHLPKYYDLENHLALLDWPIQCIGDLLRESIIRLSSPASSNTTGYPCILTSDIEPYFIEWEIPSLWISPEDYQKWKGILKPDDVVYTSVGPPVGEAAVVLASHLPMVIGGDVSVIRTNQDLQPGYLALFLNSVFGQMQNERYARGIRQRRVYPDDIASFLIPVLPKDTQSAIGQRVVRFEILNKISRELMKRAIRDMESLIDGTLDTIQIISGTIRPERWDFVERELERQENA